MNTRLTPIVLCLIGWTCLSAQPQFSTIQQASGTDYVLLEAEDFQYYDTPFLGSQRSWTTTDQAGDTFLDAVSGSSYGNNPAKPVALEAAKVQYTIQFATPGTYYYYFRYAKQDGSSGTSEILTPFQADYLPTQLAKLDAPGDTLRWAQALKKTNDRRLVFNISDVNRLYTFSFTPGDNDSRFDQIVLHKAFEANLIDFESLTPAVLAKPTRPNVTLQHTNFDEESAEYKLNDTESNNNGTVGGSGVGDGLSFTQLGKANALLDVSPTETLATLAFETVDLACAYTDLEICFSYFAPYKNNNVFQPGDELQLIVNLNNGNNASPDEVLYTATGNTLNIATDHYVQVCSSFSVPLGRTMMDARIELNANKDDEDLFIGQVYVKAAAVPAAPEIDVQYSIFGAAASFDLSASTDAFFYAYMFGDGTPITELVTDDMPAYIYPDALIYQPCFVAYDACGNQPDQWCFILDLLTPLPVDWLSFSARILGQDVQLDWATAQEIDNDYFVVEHSQNGRDYQHLAQIDARGNTQQQSNYNYTDLRRRNGTHYYRIRQVDVDGSYSYSPIRIITMEDSWSQVAIFPNPAKDQIYIDVEDFEGHALVLINSTGQAIRQWTFTDSRTPLDVSGTVAGWYNLCAMSREGKMLWVKKVLIEE